MAKKWKFLLFCSNKTSKWIEDGLRNRLYSMWVRHVRNVKSLCLIRLFTFYYYVDIIFNFQEMRGGKRRMDAFCNAFLKCKRIIVRKLQSTRHAADEDERDGEGWRWSISIQFNSIRFDSTSHSNDLHTLFHFYSLISRSKMSALGHIHICWSYALQ